MGFFTGYSSKGAMHGVLAGLGKLTLPGSTAPTSDAKRVVAAFVRGEVAHGSCRKHVCEIVATGSELKVGDLVLAKRPAGTTAHLSVCIPDRAEMVTLKSGKTVEAQKSKDVRAAAGALLKAVGAGIGVRTDPAGIRRLVGAHNKRAAEVPSQCLVVKLSKHQTAVAAAGLEASQEAQTTYTRAVPTRKQIDSVRAAQLKAKRMQALIMARAKRAGASKAAAKASAAMAVQSMQHDVQVTTKKRRNRKSQSRKQK